MKIFLKERRLFTERARAAATQQRAIDAAPGGIFDVDAERLTACAAREPDYSNPRPRPRRISEHGAAGPAQRRQPQPHHQARLLTGAVI